MKTVRCFIRGSGSAGLAIAKSLALLDVLHPEVGLSKPLFLPRNENLRALLEKGKKEESYNLLFIANPHGLHAQTILDGEEAGFDMIFCEKPACVVAEEIKRLKNIQIPVFIFHGFRQMWGPQKLKSLIEAGEFGDLISIEGRYWQSSAAVRALAESDSKKKGAWKNEVALSGPHDVLIDLATHWTDLACYLSPKKLVKVRGHLSYANSEAPHRDTHVLLGLEFDGRLRGMASISKTAHGAGNFLEMNIIGKKRGAQWLLENPDEITMAKGSKREVLRRETNLLGSQQSAYHGTGWLEGYIEIIRQGLFKLHDKKFVSPPTLIESLNVLQSLLTLEEW